MEYKILVVLSNIFFVAAGWYLGRDAGIKSTLKAMDAVFQKICNDVNAGRSLDWLEEESENFEKYK